MKIKHLSYKVEFQGRGAGHIHGVLWSKISRFESNDVKKDSSIIMPERTHKEEEFEYLTSTFKKLKDNKTLSVWERADEEWFVDKFVTCSFNPDKLGKYVSDGFQLVKLAKEVQTYSHTRTCRFHKPSLETTLFESKAEGRVG